MTGYGLASSDYANSKYSVEIKSLNSKFLELNLKLPKAFSDKELGLRNLCSKSIERGKVSFMINIERAEQDSKGASINEALFKNYYTQLYNLAQDLGSNPDGIFQSVLNLPEVLSFKDESVSEEEWAHLSQVIDTALAAFNHFRETEGETLKQDLLLRLQNILDYLKQVEVVEPTRITAIREKFNQFLEEAVGRTQIDQNRFEQELIYYIDKLDITEEKTRLRSHCDYFIETLNKAEGNGKKLGFISQEIGREINTMGSKANDAHMQQYVVGMKEELEKIKEQLLNIL